jgi:hypothetical protein
VVVVEGARDVGGSVSIGGMVRSSLRGRADGARDAGESWRIGEVVSVTAGVRRGHAR